MLKRRLSKITTILIGLLLSAAPVTGSASAATQAEQGKSLFQQMCTGCHGLGTEDRPTGPGLAGVTERRDRLWLVSFIADPGKLIAAGDPLAVELLEQFHNLPMPSLGLEPEQVEALLVYLSQPVEVAPKEQPDFAQATTAAGNGAAARGERLFTGENAFANGGAPCLACHGIAGVGLAGGANFGPDLTNLYENFGEEGIAEVLASLPFPTMEPIYATRPLTADEQHALGVYFAGVSGAPVINDRLLLIEVASGVLVLLGVVLLFGWGRLQDVRRSLVERASNQKGGKR
jgi:mono/diheme cytochrome c family protein